MDKYLYNVNYQTFDQPLWAIESRALFGHEWAEKIFITDNCVMPSQSPFIKNCLMIKHQADNYEALLDKIHGDKSLHKDIVIKYMKLISGDPYAGQRKRLYKKIASGLKGDQTSDGSTHLFGLTCYEDIWYFGPLLKNDGDWRQHSDRPHTYSNSLKGHLAKVLINLATNGDHTKTIIDPLCGAGTILLEACYLGHEIEGSDINEKMAKSAMNNLAHFGYEAEVSAQAIEDITKHYDSIIIDLPYGLYSQTTKEKQQAILVEAKRIGKRVVIVASEDIEAMIDATGLLIVDHCKVLKTKNKSFARYIYVCDQ